MKGKIAAFVVLSLLIVGVLPLASQPAEAADPAPALPSYFVRLVDRVTGDIYLKDTLEFQLYDDETATFEPYNISLLDDDWVDKAIDRLNSTQINPHPHWWICYPLTEKTQVGDCTIRDDGWNATYPYISEAYNNVIATIIELLLHFTSTSSIGTRGSIIDWSSPVGTMLFLGPNNIIVTADDICQTMWTTSFTHEPVVILGITSFYRTYLRNLATRSQTVYMTADTEAEMMGNGLLLYRTTFDILYAQPYNASNVQYATDTVESLNATLENITLIGDIYKFDFWVDENDHLELQILLLRDGILDWGFGFHLKSYLGWFFVGQLTGNVYDPELGKPIPGATITVDKMVDGLEFTAATDMNGEFVLRLPRGEYLISVTAPDYEPMESTVWVHQWDNTDVNLPMTLKPGARKVSTADRIADSNEMIGGFAAIAFVAIAILLLVRRSKNE